MRRLYNARDLFTDDIFNEEEPDEGYFEHENVVNDHCWVQ